VQYINDTQQYDYVRFFFGRMTSKTPLLFVKSSSRKNGGHHKENATLRWISKTGNKKQGDMTRQHEIEKGLLDMRRRENKLTRMILYLPTPDLGQFRTTIKPTLYLIIS
jgi:hypothetical protein